MSRKTGRITEHEAEAYRIQVKVRTERLQRAIDADREELQRGIDPENPTDYFSGYNVKLANSIEVNAELLHLLTQEQKPASVAPVLQFASAVSWLDQRIEELTRHSTCPVRNVSMTSRLQVLATARRIFEHDARQAEFMERQMDARKTRIQTITCNGGAVLKIDRAGDRFQVRLEKDGAEPVTFRTDTEREARCVAHLSTDALGGIASVIPED